MAQQERLKVLEMLRAGTISADEAETLLATLGDEPLTANDDHRIIVKPSGDQATHNPSLPDPKRLWWIPFGAGVGILAFFGWIMTLFSTFLVYVCLSPVILVGMLLTGIGIWSRSSHWIHVRVKERNGHQINISLPFPVQFAGWILTVLGPMIERRVENADLRGLNLARLVREMGDELSPENPLMVVVDDNDDHVQVYIT